MSEASRHRARLVGLAVGLLFVALAGRAGFLALSGAPEAGASVSGRLSDWSRADITDRNGELLATSVVSWSLWANPRLVWDGAAAAGRLAELFPDLDRGVLERRLSDQRREFVWVKRGLTPRQREQVMALGVEGLDFREETRRAYPRGVLAGQLLGYTNVDGRGIAGAELAYDEALSGGGPPVRLTLDIGVQAGLEAELATAAMDYDMRAGAAVLIQLPSGEVRGMASWPPFDPNRAGDTPADDPARVNHALGAVYELGSVYKPLTIAAALDAGAVSPSDRFEVGRPYVIRGFPINDTHWFAAEADLASILSESSNIGTVRVNLALGAERQMDFLERAGLTRRTELDLPGAAAPLLPRRLDELTSATLSYGHGMSVSPLSFLTAFAAFGNDGLLVQPRILEEAPLAAPVRLMSEQTARTVTGMMRQSVMNGTGSQADVAGYRVAGKTGTAEKAVAGGYDETRNVTSFAAVFPADSPEYALIVTLDEPGPIEGGMRGAGVNAAPVAGRIVERVAPLLGIDPRFEDVRPMPGGSDRPSVNRSEL